MTPRWDDEADLVVIGYGAAGAATAIQASRLGGSVVVLEKQAQDRHTPSTRMSGGMFMVATDVERAATYLDICAGGMVPREISRAWAERMMGLVDWFHSLGTGQAITYTGKCEHLDVDGADAIEVWQPGTNPQKLAPGGGAGRALMAALEKAVAATPARVRYATPARRLIREEGRVVGVLADGPDGPVRVRAHKGVVLSPGGYEYDEETKLNYLRGYPMYFYGNPGNTGDGLRMAQEMGAGLWHMNQMIGRAIGNFPMPDGSDLSFIIFIGPPGYVITDQFGKRYAGEHIQAGLLHGFYYSMLEYDNDTGTSPRNPSYWFFDETRRQAGPLTLTYLGACAVGLYEWSPDNSKEIENGWIARGETIEDAARAAGHPAPEQAAAEVAEHNRRCAAGEADPLGRPAETMIGLTKGPFYCVKLVPGGSNTTGGPTRNAKGQILDVFGEPIPGLYGAGELGQPTGMRYPADGTNLSEAMCFGQIVAEQALGRETN